MLNGDAMTLMELKQILFILLWAAVCVCSKPCYKETELEGAAKKRLQHHNILAVLPTQASTVPISCPLTLYQHHTEIEDRSISPWIYVKREMPDHFPSTYYEARCLCNGCISESDEEGPYEDFDYNSAPVNHSMTFLKRELCEGTGGERRYRLKEVTVNVYVACTCVRPERRELS